MRAIFDFHIMRIVFVTVICLFVFQSQVAGFAGGTGTPDDPYQIATAEQLISIGDDPNLLDKHYVLVDDIDLDPNLPGGRVFTQAVIASYKMIPQDGPLYKTPKFSGSLDGNGHSISNFVIGIDSSGPRSDFGFISNLSGIVKDIQLRNITIRSVYIDVGGLVGSNRGKILRCSVTGSIIGKSSVGGLVGSNDGDIVSCSSFCNVQSVSEGVVGDAGGLVGFNFFNGCISNCYAAGTVTGEKYVGGLVGNNFGYIFNCYAIGTVAGEKYVGGLIGNHDIWGILNPTVSQCYAACEIIADPNDSIGGLIGKSIGQTTDSFWDIQVSGQKISAGGIGLPTAKLQDSRTYLSAGWDMTGETSNGVADIWTITEPNTYPQLTRLTDQYSITQLPGSGTADDPYKIATAEELVAINDYDINAHYALVVDIDMSGMVWATAPIFFFNGTFDGRGHTISNLTIKGHDYLGLFGKILTNGVVRNLVIQDACIIGNKYVGALAGVSLGHITNCHVTGSTTGVTYVGGLVGSVIIPGNFAFENYVSDCSADVAVSGNDNVQNIANVDYIV
jgi:hypothetical protein